jgi:hypothetical protein
MKLDVQKLDDRIRKLQELRRLASDPEMSLLLTEFLGVEGERQEPLPEPVHTEADNGQLVADVVRGLDVQASGGLFRRRG